MLAGWIDWLACPDDTAAVPMIGQNAREDRERVSEGGREGRKRGRGPELATYHPSSIPIDI